MNHNPMPPYGQPPMHPSRRQHEIPYPSMPPNMRHQPYQGYYPPHVGGPIPQYPPQHFQQQWYPYQHMPPHMPPPHRPYQPPPMHPQHSYQPLVVSSYPMPQAQQHPAHVQPAAVPPQSSPRPVQELPPQPYTALSPPPPSTPSSINNVQETPPASSAASIVSENPSVAPSVPESTPKEPFEPPVSILPGHDTARLITQQLPWLSVTDEPFPPRARRRRHRVLKPQSDLEPVQFPSREQMLSADASHVAEIEVEPIRNVPDPLPSDDGTPQTSIAPSENDSTQPTTPSSAVVSSAQARTQQTPTQPKSARAFAPAMPAMPVIPTSPTTPRKSHRDSVVSNVSKAEIPAEVVTDGHVTPRESADVVPTVASPNSEQTPKVTSPPPAPKSWADLVRSRAPPASQAPAGGLVPATVESLKSETLAGVLTTMSTDAALHPSKLSFLEPRGLVNTGNMCYMNSVSVY